MTRSFTVDHEIKGLHAYGVPVVVGNCSIVKAAFNNNSICGPDNPQSRSVVKKVYIKECQHWACSADGVIFEDVTIKDVRGGGRSPSFLWGCVFSHVEFLGWIGGLMFRWQVDPWDKVKNRLFRDANLAIYEAIDWAVDIREANFSFFLTLDGVPPHLARRNPDRHFVMSSDQARQVIVQSPSPTVWRLVAESLLESELAAVVVVPGGTGRKVKTYIEEAEEWRSKGLLE